MITKAVFDPLCARIESSLGRQRREIAELLKGQAQHVLSETSVTQLLGGLRGVVAVACDTSEVNPQHGLAIRGRRVKDLAAQNLETEQIFWLLLTGSVADETAELWMNAPFLELAGLQRSHCEALTPSDLHPISAICIALQNLQHDSITLQSLPSTEKSRHWRLVFEDALAIYVNLPRVIAKVYHADREHPMVGHGSWGLRLADAVGIYDYGRHEELQDLMRLYVLVHCDHEGSNACALACRTAASTLADPYLALTAGWRALAGPIHGLASQVCIEFIDEILAALGEDATDEQLAAFVQQRIDAGRVIPGFGHAVLRAMDPRYELLHAFAKSHFPDDPAFRIADGLLRVVPPLLMATGKVANPWPNVDGISGVVMKHYGLTDYRWLTVLFAACMSLGLLAQMVVSRGLGEPILHPKAVTPELLRKMVED